MTKNTSDDEGHPVDLLLPFLENTLDPSESATVKKHVEQCDHCAQELRLFEKMTSALKNDKNLFCPEPWEIYEFVETGQDPGQRIAYHLNDCSLCQHEVETLKSASVNREMPKQIWKKLESALPQHDVSKVQPVKNHSFWKFPNWSFDFLKIPMLATASAVAILCVVLLFPWSQPKFIVALSPEDWNQSPTSLKLMSPRSQNLKSVVTPKEHSKPIVVIIVILDDSSREFNRERIDSLYRSLRPSRVLADKFEFVSPSRMKNLIESGAINNSSRKEMLEGIRDQLKVTEAIIINIIARKHDFKIEGQLIGTETGKVIKEKSETNLSESQLTTKLRDITEFLGSQ